MANLNEAGDWPEGIYQLEETDFVQGGVDGVDNPKVDTESSDN